MLIHIFIHCLINLKKSTEGDSDDEDESAQSPDLLDKTLSSEELTTIQDIADATRLAAKITDMPANVMDVDAFIEVSIQYGTQRRINVCKIYNSIYLT